MGYFDIEFTLLNAKCRLAFAIDALLSWCVALVTGNRKSEFDSHTLL